MQVRIAPPSDDRIPVIGRFFPDPAAAKVPEILAVFWVTKLLTTAGGEVTSDWLKRFGNFGGGGAEVAMFVIGLLLQFGTRRYRAFAYWFLAYAIATAGTGISDFLHLDVHIPYAGTSGLWAVILAVIFVLWHRSEGTLSIHSITSQRREAYYWATVFATFALGTALGDYTATSLSLGYLDSIFFFLGIILIPVIGWWRFSWNPILAFWFAYIVTRPLGASVSDWISKPQAITGLNFGNGPAAIVFASATLVVVAYLATVRPDVQSAPQGLSGRSQPVGGDLDEPEAAALDLREL